MTIILSLRLIFIVNASQQINTLQGNLQVYSVFGGKDSMQLKGAEITSELRRLLNLLTLCWHFSKKPFPLFLEETGYSQDDVLLQEPKAGVSSSSTSMLLVMLSSVLIYYYYFPLLSLCFMFFCFLLWKRVGQ